MPSNQSPLPCYTNQLAFSHTLFRGYDGFAPATIPLGAISTFLP
jgi:hypothetical protein